MAAPVRSRCAWVPATDPLSIAYHDAEWGVPQHDDRTLFELLVLEGAQAGLSWRIILARRDGYRQAFAGFDPERVAAFGDEEVERLLCDARIVRNRAKVRAAVGNARATLRIRDRHGSLDAFLWGFVGGRPEVHHWTRADQVPASTPTSTMMSRTLVQAGFQFVGPTICYAFMQAAGLVMDHEVNCYRHAELSPS